MNVDRRQFRRYTVSIEVAFEVGEVEYTGTMSDLSLGGCYILSAAEVVLRSHLGIRVHLTTERWLSLRGMVTHHYPKQGFGIRFEFASKAEEEIIARLVDHLNRNMGTHILPT